MGAAYSIVGWLGLPHSPATILWKGAGVGLLAVWAAARARDRDGWWFVVVLMLGAVGDVLLDAVGNTVGGTIFFLGHVAAIAFYIRHRAARGGVVVAAACALGGAVLAYALARDLGGAIYTLGVCAMAVAAAQSRFPARVGLGAALFVVSDLLIFAAMGPLRDSVLPSLLIWPLYFAGQALIAHGVVTTLAEEHRG